MTNNCTDAVPMDGHRLGLFVCGAVFGVCLGFAAGHVLVWGRVQSDDALSPEDWLSAANAQQAIDTSAANAAHQFAHRGANAASGQVPGPFYASAIRRLGSDPPAVDMTAREKGIRVVAETSTTAAEPDTLPHAVPAAPIDEQTLYREQVTRSIIAQEMPHATPQEQDVWFDVLRGLDAADVKGILRMRKHVGGDTLTVPGRARPDPSPFASRPGDEAPRSRSASVRSEWADALACLQQLRDIRLHNLTNADTIGYGRQLPVMNEAHPDAWGVRLAGIGHDWFSGESYYTLNPLDVMIKGMGFLKLSRADEVRLTRCGRLTIDDQRFLALSLADASWRVDPPVQLPEKVLSVTISEDGVVSARTPGEEAETEIGRIVLVTVYNPKALRHTGGGLYALTAACGAIQPVDADVKLLQHHVERMSPAVIQVERCALERIEWLIERVIASQDSGSRSPTQPEPNQNERAKTIERR